MRSLRRYRWVVPATMVLAIALIVACGGTTEDFRSGGTDAQKAVDGFLTGWISASGPRNDTITASQTRRFLGCELGTRVAGAQVGGGQEAEKVEVVYNEIMTLPFPPDAKAAPNGPGPYVIESSSADSDTTATFTVKLNYTETAASSMAALGLIPFEKVQEAHDATINGPERVLHLQKDPDKGWQICSITTP